jgi:hypothetical protein
MRHQGWSQQPDDLDDQETVYTNQSGETPPTLPLGDERGWGQQEHGFVRTDPQQSRTPGPYGPEAPRDQTMLIGDRPSPVFAWLVVVDSPDRSAIGAVHVLQPGTTTIGRVPGNNIVIRDEYCSAQHARIRIESHEEQGPIYALFDMGSANGTYVGDRQSYKAEEQRKYRHELQDGDYLLMGETTLAFKKL